MAAPGDVVAGTVRGTRRWAIAAGILLVLGGILALAAPVLAALVATLTVAWGLISGAVAELISAWSSRENRHWKGVLGVLYLAVGVYMLLSPGEGLLAIALTLAWLFVVQGLISIFGAFQLRPLPGWGWWLLDGVVTLVLAFLIFLGWPGDSATIIAILVGASLVISGANRLALAATR